MAIILNGTTGITTPDITSAGSLNIDASAPDNSLVVNSAGNVGIGTITFVADPGILTLSKGITFPATQVASADANTLDDYEEGTFTPSLTADAGSGVTYVHQSGRYTKIGNVVHIAYVLGLTSKGTITGTIYLEGLPFIVENVYSGSAEPWALGVSYVAGLSTSVVNISGWCNNASTFIQLRKQTAAATSFGSSYLGASDISDSFGIQCSATYRV